MRPGERNRERGRVRDISGQYRRRALTTKILASLNRRFTITELRPPELQAHKKKPLCHTSATQIVETGSESLIKDKEKRIETETNHPPSIQSDHRNHRHTKIHPDILPSL